MVSISYTITTHNEGSFYLENLFQALFKYIAPEDEIIVVDDFSDEPSTISTLEKYKDRISLYQNKLDGDFSQQKNFAKSKCTKEYIFFIDADEIPCDTLMLTLKEILFNNPDVELYHVPRVNLVQGLTPEDISKWGWVVNDKQRINYPDLQTRIIKNKSEILWTGKVHEKLVGNDTHTVLPYETEDYCLIHVKNIERQRSQNKFYESL
jgi:glycosyltransferase involved in cell wall biosynthesis